jgi:hypothetical protein
LRRLKVGKVLLLLEMERVRECRCQHPVERRRIEGLFRAHVGAAVDQKLVVLVEELIALLIVEGCGSRWINCSRSHGSFVV